MVTTELSARRIVRRSPTPVVATRSIGGVATCRDLHMRQLTPAPTTRTATAAAATMGTRQPRAGAAGAAGSLAVMRSRRRAHSSSVRQARRSGGVLLLLLTAQRPAAGAKTLPRPFALRLEQWTQLLSGGGQQLLDALEADVHRLGNLGLGHLVVALEHERQSGARRKAVYSSAESGRGARRLRALRRRAVAIQQRPRRRDLAPAQDVHRRTMARWRRW